VTQLPIAEHGMVGIAPPWAAQSRFAAGPTLVT
jgi:hypothetical protein